MTFVHNLIKKEARQHKQPSQAQLRELGKNAEIAQKMFEALNVMDADVARTIVQKPAGLKVFLNKDEKNTIKAPYVLHALVMLLSLSGVAYDEVLNKMPDEDIRILKELLLVAQTQPHPNKESLQNALTERQNKARQLNSSEAQTDKVIISSLRASIDVADYWSDTTRELKNWINAINNYKRTDAVIKEIKTKQKDGKIMIDWMTADDVAHATGCKNAQYFYIKKGKVLKRNPQMADEINGWFEVVGGRKLFNPEHLPELKALFAPQRNRTKKSTRPAAVATATVDASQTGSDKAQKKPVATKSLIDFKALEAFVAGLDAILTSAQNELAAKNKEYQEKLDAVCAIKESDKRVELLQQMTVANNAVVAAEEACVQAAKKHELATKYLNDIRVAQNALSKMMAENTNAGK